MVELASGIDALYLSGNATVSDSLREQLAIGRAAAERDVPSPSDEYRTGSCGRPGHEAAS